MYRGMQYRFCSRDCLDKFEATPETYIGAAHDVRAHGEHHS
jgi:YHS domain-containing protein